ncbi:hypothetical protein QBC43DRAFT_334583 [Cladorrhinum sp. PSN259]|nr:hypothetical protein QBC43DRAFT_334583 [Cladorrhinum sp. PSN259]
MEALPSREDCRQRISWVCKEPGSTRKSCRKLCSVHDKRQAPSRELVSASHKAFAKDFKLSTPMPAEIVALTSRRRTTLALRQSNSVSGMEENMVKPGETVNNLVRPATPPPPALTSTVPASSLHRKQTEQKANKLSPGYEEFNRNPTAAHPPLWLEHCLRCLDFFSTASSSVYSQGPNPFQTRGANGSVGSLAQVPSDEQSRRKEPSNSDKCRENCRVNALHAPPLGTGDVLSARPPIKTVCPDARGLRGKLDLSKLIQHMPESEKKAEKEDEGATASRCTAGSGAQAQQQQPPQRPQQQPQQQIPATVVSSSAHQQEQELEAYRFMQELLSRARSKQVYTYIEQLRKAVPITAEDIAEAAAAAGVVSDIACQQDPQQQQPKPSSFVRDSSLIMERPKGHGVYDFTRQYREVALLNAKNMAAAAAASAGRAVQTAVAAQAAEDGGDNTRSLDEWSDEDYEFIDRDECV